MTKAVISAKPKRGSTLGQNIIVTYVSNDRSFAQSYLNVNAFPHYVMKEVISSETRFAIFHYQIKLLKYQLENDRILFDKFINDPEMELASALMKKAIEDYYVVKFDGIEFLTYIQNLFYSLKSFLDVYTLLLTRLIKPDQTNSFKRKNVDGQLVSGGAFIRWLRKSAPKSYNNAGVLADFVLKETKEWITEAVDHRDIISHYSDIDDINCLCVELNKLESPMAPIYEPKKVSDPVMPDGTTVLEYAQFLGSRLRNYVIGTLAMFDNIKHELLSSPDFDADQAIWP